MKRTVTTCLAVLAAVAALSSCNAAGGDGDVVATVDGHELTADELDVLTEGSTNGPTVRSALTAWTRIAAVSDEMPEMRSLADLDAARGAALDAAMAQVGDAPRTDYENGLGGSSFLCVAAIPLDPEVAAADVIAEIRDGLSFADAAAKYSSVERFAANGGVLTSQDGQTCFDNATFESGFPGIIDLLNDAQATVGNPAAIEEESGDVVFLLRGYDDLTADEQRVVAQVELSGVLGADLDEADVDISSRFGSWDATAREVVGAERRVTTPRVVVVGLGPSGPEYVTDHTLAHLARVPHRFLRTSRHPSAHLVADATTFDDVYEDADTFADVYAEIVERLVAAATEHGEIVYTVPGSPLVLERTVRALMADPRIECAVQPAMSFLDVVYSRLGIDPVETGITLVDGHEFATSAAGATGPLLVAHTHANWVLSDIKLAVEHASGDEPVVILQRLGAPDELVTHTTWAELDRTVEADHLTSVYIPRLDAPVAAELVRFHQLSRTLREQCPWDQEQTHQSLVRYLLEETFEVVDAVNALDPDDPAADEHLVEELGDLLYQVVFHATIAEQEGRFTLADVARGVHDKLVRRHPHVFPPAGGQRVQADDTATVLENWDAIKQQEKGRTSIFEGVPRSLPALSYADAVQRKAAKVGFDWPDVDGALPKIAEEAAELRVAAESSDPAATADELGDLLFAVVNVARHLHVEPESALRAATVKFRSRFEQVERLAVAAGIDLRSADLSTLDGLWDQVKALE